MSEEKKTRLVRQDATFQVTAQLEVAIESSSDDARAQCERAIYQAIQRAKEDKAISFERKAEENRFLDPKGPKKG